MNKIAGSQLVSTDNQMLKSNTCKILEYCLAKLHHSKQFGINNAVVLAPEKYKYPLL